MTATAEQAPAEQQLIMGAAGADEQDTGAEQAPEPQVVARKATAPRKAARSRAASAQPPAQPSAEPVANGAEGASGGSVAYEPPSQIRPPVQADADKPVLHPIYGDKKLYSYAPKDGSAPIVLPHISNARPTPKFFYRNRKKDEMHQAFAWMDLCEIPDAIGERIFDLPPDEQSTVISEWFGGLNLTPAQGVAPPGES